MVTIWNDFNYRYTLFEEDSCNTGGGDLCNSGECTHDDASTHSTPSKMVREGVVDFKNEISNICSMETENMVIIVSLNEFQIFAKIKSSKNYSNLSPSLESTVADLV